MVSATARWNHPCFDRFRFGIRVKDQKVGEGQYAVVYRGNSIRSCQRY